MLDSITSERSTSQKISDVLADISDDPRFVHLHRQQPRSASFVELPTAPPAAVAASLPHRLWTHQADAITRIRAGESVVISTGTASGKSLCFQIPVAEAVLDGATALMVYPTKALAQDQLSSLTSWQVPGMVAAAYDGDCTPEERLWVRANANVLFTNPEMLHNSILPSARQWAEFLGSVRVVVVDELHVLRGLFGSNVAHVLRRLRRAIHRYGGKEPTFVFTSATIGDADRLAGELSGLRVGLIDSDHSPQSERDVVIWNPNDARDHLPLSVNTEAATMATRLMRAGLRTMVFCGSRRSTEVVAEMIRSQVGEHQAVRSYRGGYRREERREIENELFSGQLMGIVATSALELGVDIGGLDAVVMSGYPGTVASFRQQLGRSGRSVDPSIAVLIAGENQLDQWICANPRELFDRPPEPAAISLDNPFVFVPHLGCAAHESPLTPTDIGLWPTQLDEGVRQLVVSDRARISRSGPDSSSAVESAEGSPQMSVIWSGRGSPARTISLRSAGGSEFRVVHHSGGRVGVSESPDFIGTIPESSLYTSAHLGAIYLHQGTAWRVVGVDEAIREISVEPDPGDTYTLAKSTKLVTVESWDATTPMDGWAMSIGAVEVITSVTSYQVRSTTTHEVIGREKLDVPDSSLRTRAICYSFNPGFLESAGIDPPAVPGSLHAAEHAAIGMLPLFAICDRWDVGGLSTEWLPETASPAIIIHDSFPGGAGMAEMAFAQAPAHLGATLDLLLSCRCVDGCPRCVQSPKCGNGNEPLDKVGAARLLSVMCGKDPNDVPEPEFVGF